MVAAAESVYGTGKPYEMLGFGPSGGGGGGGEASGGAGPNGGEEGFSREI